MLLRTQIFILFFIASNMISVPNTIGQTQDDDKNIFELAYLADIMRNTIVPNHRMKAGTEFYALFKDHLKDETTVNKNFDYLSKFISIISPQDSSFRIFTWQLDLEEKHQYFGLIQFSTGELVELTDKSSELLTATYEELDKDNWYGALYYNIKDFRSERKTHYLLFGYNAKNPFSNQKLIEVLSIDKDKKLIFGAPVFVMDDARRPDEKYRYILEYQESAIARLNYDKTLDKIVFDHLIPYGPYINDETEAMVPDGSYSSFEFKKGKWIFNEKLFHQTSDKPPGSGKKKEGKRKDLFGQ